MALARLAVRLYRAPRRLTVGGTVTEAVRPNRGVLPGCGWAMALIKAHYREPFVEIMRAHLGVALNVVVDDIQITACGSSDFAVEALVEVASGDIDQAVVTLHGPLLADHEVQLVDEPGRLWLLVDGAAAVTATWSAQSDS